MSFVGRTLFHEVCDSYYTWVTNEAETTVSCNVRGEAVVLIGPTNYRHKTLQNRPNYVRPAASFLVDKESVGSLASWSVNICR